MTADEILDQIELLYPKAATAWSDAQKVDFLNIEQDNIFDILQVESTYDFILIDDTARYALPSDMQIDLIKRVMVSNDANVTTQDGTVSATAGAKAVTGSGTAFTSDLEDEYIVINGELKIVDTVSSVTSLTVTTNFESSASDVSWSLYATPEEADSFIEYLYQDYDKILTRSVYGGWYKISSGSTDYIGFYPLPTETGKTVRVIYRPTPSAISADSLTTTPDLYYRWHVLLVYAAIAEIAGSGDNPDIDIANLYTRKYNEVLERAKENRFERDKPGYVVMRNVMRSNNNARRIMTGRSRRLPNSMFVFEEV
jgi:hypothetical protein